MRNTYRYSMNIRWHEPDALFVVDVPELPGCTTHGGTYEEAVQQAQEVIELWLEANADNPMFIPPPSIVYDPDSIISPSPIQSHVA